jgi:hypothetical protein
VRDGGAAGRAGRGIARRGLGTALAVAVLAGGLAAGPVTGAAAAVADPTASVAAPKVTEGWAPYLPQTSCDPVVKPGTLALRTMLLAAYGGRDLGITRACDIGGQSEHKEGRAWDWTVSVESAYDRAAARKVFTWLLRADAKGRRYAMARRLGVMYIIRTRRIWGSYRAAEGWRPYVGANPHTDHVHISFSWAGARKQTSYWDGSPVTY